MTTTEALPYFVGIVVVFAVIAALLVGGIFIGRRIELGYILKLREKRPCCAEALDHLDAHAREELGGTL